MSSNWDSDSFDPTKWLDIGHAHPSLGPAERILDEDVVGQFRELFNEIVRCATEDEAGLAGAVDRFRSFVIGYNGTGASVNTDIVYELSQLAGVDIAELTGLAGEAFLEQFRAAAAQAEIELAAPVVKPQEEDELKKRHHIVPGFYKGPLTYEMIIESAQAVREAHPLSRRPIARDPGIIMHGPLAYTGLTWAAVDISLRQGSHRLRGGESLASVLDEAGIPPKFIITHEMIIESARAEQDAHPLKRRPVCGDSHEIKHGPLAHTGMTWVRIKNALRRGIYSLPGGETLSGVLEQAGLPRTQTVTHQMILRSAFWVQEASPDMRRPTAEDTALIRYGPLAGTGLSWRAVDQALKNGSHNLPGGKTLAQIFDEAGLPKSMKDREAAMQARARRIHGMKDNRLRDAENYGFMSVGHALWAA